MRHVLFSWIILASVTGRPAVADSRQCDAEDSESPVTRPEPRISIEIPGRDDAALTMVLIPVERRACFLEKHDPRSLDTDNSFYMSAYEITQKQWHAIMTRVKTSGPYPDHPMTDISWSECVEFCERLSERTGHTFSLPMAWEWEYACRAGTSTKFSFGDALEPHQANFNWPGKRENNRADFCVKPVGSYPPNAWGLYDMHGNVEEWCCDRDVMMVGPDSLFACTGSVTIPSPRVIMGGSFLFFAESCSPGIPYIGMFPDSASYTRGMRIVMGGNHEAREEEVTSEPQLGKKLDPDLVVHSPMIEAHRVALGGEIVEGNVKLRLAEVNVRYQSARFINAESGETLTVARHMSIPGLNDVTLHEVYFNRVYLHISFEDADERQQMKQREAMEMLKRASHHFSRSHGRPTPVP